MGRSMQNNEIGKYYIRLKSTHIEWKRKTGPRGNHGEAYLAIPAKYAYLYGIKNGHVFQCNDEENGFKFELKAEGTQRRREYAKQFAGNGDLSTLYNWYKNKGAIEGDFVIVTIYKNNIMSIRYIGQNQLELTSKYGLEGSSGRPLFYEYISIGDHGIKLISLLVKNSENVICDISFLREDIGLSSECPMTSLIIGSNGSGKSSVLKYITEIINACLGSGPKKTMQFSYYYLKYYLGNQTIEIIVSNNTVLLTCDGKVIENQINLYLPQKVLAIAFMLNDKYVYKSQGSSGVYEYLGIKATSNAAWTNVLSNRISENIIDITINDRLITLIDVLSEYLQLERKFAITFDFGDEKIDYANEDINDIRVIIEGTVAKVKEGKDFRGDVARKITDENMDLYARFVQQKAQQPITTSLKDKKTGLWIKNKGIDNIQTLKKDYQIIRTLSSIGIIKNVTLWLYKNGKVYSFEEASSGEKHILYMATSIARYICDNSIILIDEPEISLHPNWQMKYINFLKKAFAKYSSCHFLIASHSPYLVSDLASDSSSLISLKYENDKRVAETIDYDTYAWSAENVLYNIFGVRTTRNYYFEADMQELLTNMSQSKNYERVKELYMKLSRYYLSDEDPLHLVLNEVKEYIDNAES